jgi:cysteine-rich repeat protein
MRPNPLFMTFLSLSIGCQDQGVTAFNAKPFATITSHQDGDEIDEGYLVLFRGSVSDPDHGTSDLTTTWYLGSELVCASAYPDSDGVTTCEALIESDDDEITLEVHDPLDAADSYTIGLNVVPTDAPESGIVSPEVSGVYYSDQKITFAGLVSDSEDEPTDLTAWWVSDIDGQLIEVDAEPDASGEVVGHGYLTKGEHAVELWVADTTGKTGTSSVIISVGPPNSAPTCQITSPLAGSVGEEGEPVVFEALVDDVDVAPDWLTVTWESDKDGAMGTSTPYSSGEVQFSWSDLSVDSHTITMTVTDEVGATCTDGMIYTVGTAPEVSISSPGSGSTFNEGETISFSATVGDNEDRPTDLTLSWESVRDGVLSTQGADSAGSAVFNSSTLSPGDHDVTLTVTDTDGLYSTALVHLTINALPTAPTVEIIPDPATTTNDLVAVASGSTDPDGSGTVSYSYAWYEAGLLSSASTSATFPASATSRDLAYTVVVTPSDGTGDGEPGSASITISNSEPVISTPVISPAYGITTSENLSCSSSASDDDGDTPAVTYTWTSAASGATLGTGSSLSLTPSSTTPGDTITCIATATDDVDVTASASASVSVDNSDPVLAGVTISPSSRVTTSTTLSCIASATDADGGSPTMSFDWTQGGVSVGSTDTLVLDPFSYAPGDVISCTVTATDADGGSDTDSDTVTVENSAPSISSVSIVPDPAHTGDSLSCSYSGFSDPDGDADASTILWTSGTTTLGSGATLASGFTGGDLVTCTVTPSDGADDGTPISASITIANTVPSISSVSISPVTPTASDVLSCSYTGFADADGDPDHSSYEWSSGGVSLGSGATLGGVFRAGDTVVCTVTPDDGHDEGTTVSASVTVQNTAPTVSSLVLSPSEVYTNDTIIASVSTSDSDGDSVSVSYAWYVDGRLVSETGSSLDGAAYFDKGQAVYVVATPNDGTSVGTPVASSTVTVLNTLPTAPSVTIDPAAPTAGTEDLVCSIVSASSDADGDAITYEFAWTVDGLEYGTGAGVDTGDTGSGWIGPLTTTHTDDTVAGDDTLEDDTWICTVTPDDGEDQGDSGDAQVTIGGDDGDSMYMKVTWFLDSNRVEVIPDGFTGTVTHLHTWWGNHSIRMDLDNDGSIDFSHADTYYPDGLQVDDMDLDYDYTNGFSLQDYYLWNEYWYDDTHGAINCWARDCSYDPWGAGATFLIDSRDFSCDGNVWKYDGVQVSSSPIYCRGWNTCGDGAVEGSEECDDYNRADGDGCSAECLLE